MRSRDCSTPAPESLLGSAAWAERRVQRSMTPVSSASLVGARFEIFLLQLFLDIHLLCNAPHLPHQRTQRHCRCETGVEVSLHRGQTLFVELAWLKWDLVGGGCDVDRAHAVRDEGRKMLLGQDGAGCGQKNTARTMDGLLQLSARFDVSYWQDRHCPHSFARALKASPAQRPRRTGIRCTTGNIVPSFRRPG